ncbi:PREDICTED: sprouty-related, EVH1 domain-containing protein 2 isoform X1 [Polistes dominula]|uniref:Sprouty-related, EVH1 domain-containing protein 2 isoform X1 n=1 Tax=Polistes dominula TaxID=743375 RepID=A0ABM1JEN2_POLDO|nr:PREDICTED: sprouty-related, EVH1 domain-containing protein 2 isoform X1 [Polistes dominula]XP_015190921.1 PREDICTED: sprouty-related, EVH1 domain-containing protein 2 isoform X1 [Polistes dominula]
MTEASEDGNYLVRVCAQVMTRDDSSGGWVPLSGGGLANVSVRRRATSVSGLQSNNTNGTSISTSNVNTTTSSTTVNAQGHGSSTSPPSATKRKHEYLIYGKRITDQSVVLSCTIKKDFEYNKVMPTFHHWRTGEKKFGLTFRTAADARAFDKGVRTAVEELLEGLAESTLCCNPADGGDEDVFMTLNLPVDPLDPRPSSDTSRGVVRVPIYHPQCPDVFDSHNKPIHYIGGSANKVSLSQHPLTSTADIGSDNYSYVHLTTVNHEYLYPIVDDHKSDRLDRHSSGSSLKKPDIIVSQPSKNTFRRNVQLRCKHCQEIYSEQHNPRGSCEDAPDPIRRGIATISCLSCAQCMLYHCMSDSEGEFTQNPCSCNTEEGCGRRWIGLALLSLIVPCLWIYPPLRAVHWCGMSCGMCGGRHHPME